MLTYNWPIKFKGEIHIYVPNMSTDELHVDSW